MSEYSQKVSFWDLLKRKNIVIPIIQRDYAQGRKGKEFLRERFLKQLFDALQDDAEPLVLDFVYGSTEEDTLYPLDGQQRLTTLWLLHWYLALRAGTLSEDKNILKHFSYETRVSSRTFCHKLCSISQPYQSQKADIAGFVRNQSWFYSAYEQDPTIQSMLRMLGGTDIKDNNDIDIIDGIEEYATQLKLTEDKAKELLERLKSADSPISFYLLNMEDKNMPLTDDLYIKMNARGKTLTDFENFKADLLKYKLSDREYLIPENDTSENSFSLLLDTRWTDLFWPYRSAEYHIDEIYLNFLNRFFLNWYIARCNTDATAEEVTARDFYKQLSAAINGKNKDYRYQSISIYNQVLTRECIASLQTCLNRLYDLYQKAITEYGKEQASQVVDSLLSPYWENKANDDEGGKTKKTFYFIPRYETGNTPDSINLQQQVVFHAVCVYLTTCQTIDFGRLKEWMHVVWNIVENSYIDSEQSVSAIRFFDRGLHALPRLQDCESTCQASDDIITFLAGTDEGQLKNIFGRRQRLEEIAKARQIKADNSWKEKIDAAERFAFFKGAIAFLFNNEKGETDWSYFDRKLDTAQLLFDKDGVKTEQKVHALRTLYSYCNNWDAQFGRYAKIFNGSANTWKNNILTKVGNDNSYTYAAPVHHLLMGDGPSEKTSDDRRMRLLTDESLVSFLVTENKNDSDMYIRGPHDALYYCGYKYGVMLNFERRDTYLNLLLDEGVIELTDRNRRIDNTGLFWGDFNINFLYHARNGRTLHLQWYQQRNYNAYDIYLMTDEWGYKMRPESLEYETGDRKKYYCFNVEEPNDDISIVEQFHKQIEENFLNYMNKQ